MPIDSGIFPREHDARYTVVLENTAGCQHADFLLVTTGCH